MDEPTPLRPRQRPPVKLSLSRRGLTIAAVVVAVVVLLVVIITALGFYVDWLWFREVGLRVVFWKRLWWRLIIGVPVGLIFFVIVAANVEIARRLAPRFKATAGGDLVEFAGENAARAIGAIGFIVAALMGLLAGIAASTKWLDYLLAFKGTAFGRRDPLFHHDLSFYIFSLPAWHHVQSLLFSAAILALLASTAVHLALGGISYTYGGASGAPRLNLKMRLEGRAVAHLSALLAAVFVLTGVGQLFKAWHLLYSGAGVVFGAGYTDVSVRLPILRVMMVVALLLAAALIANVWWRRQWWPAAIGVWIAAFIVLEGIVPLAVQGLIVSPNQLAKERTYIARNIAATRAAYNLTKIAQRQLPMHSELTAAKLQANPGTVRNIRLWDPGTLVTSYKQLQELRPYYSFLDADVDRYTVNGVYTQTMLSARELNIGGIPQQSRTWLNQHLTFTHGFGVALSAVNQVTADGSPDFLVQDVPPVSAKGLEITQPRIYYGEKGTDYTFVGTKVQEFDYPRPGGDAYRSYDGRGGIPISSFLNRLAFTLRFRTIKFFTSSAIDSKSRVIIYNNIQKRVRKAAPFLTFDHDPYMVIADGRLYWIIDAYTTTSLYPYSQPQGGVNYIRNSVKAVVDAYNGTVTFYAFDQTDPILRTYEKIFPQMFKPLDAMPTVLRRHVRYPEDYFNTQAEVYATYHVQDPSVLYNKGDQWQIPSNVALSGPGRMSAYYVIMRLPGATKEQFLLMLPFVPNGRSNMISWLGAQSDGADYGKAVNFVFSSSTTVFGPSQVESTINSDPRVSSQLTLWNQRGSRAIMGNLLVVPIQDTLLYVQPLYLVAEQIQLPQLKEVIVFYRSPSVQGTQGNVRQVVAMQPTLSLALAEVFGVALPTGPSGGQGGATPSKPAQGGGTTVSARAAALIAQANREFNAALAAQRSGDWAGYGRQLAALKKTLGQLAKLR